MGVRAASGWSATSLLRRPWQRTAQKRAGRPTRYRAVIAKAPLALHGAVQGSFGMRQAAPGRTLDDGPPHSAGTADVFGHTRQLQRGAAARATAAEASCRASCLHSPAQGAASALALGVGLCSRLSPLVLPAEQALSLLLLGARRSSLTARSSLRLTSPVRALRLCSCPSATASLASLRCRTPERRQHHLHR
jgi:hypothetical protein